MSKVKTALEKSVESTVRAVVKGKEDNDIVNQLCCVQEQIKFHSYSQEEREKYFPSFSSFNIMELKQIRKQVYERLKEIIYSPDITYLQTFRIIVTINALECEIPVKGNSKIKFCKNYWRMCCAEGRRVDFYMKEIKLLDQ